MERGIQFIGQSSAFLDAVERASRAAQLNRPVLVIGERGTGKELIAERLHRLSTRWDGPLVTMNCAALPETLQEWQAKAEQHPGSWWAHWADWLGAKSGEKIAARDPKAGPLKPIEPAPGAYVKVKS